MSNLENLVKSANFLLEKMAEGEDTASTAAADTLMKPVNPAGLLGEMGLKAIGTGAMGVGGLGVLHHLLTKKRDDEGKVHERTFSDYLPWLLAGGGGYALRRWGPDTQIQNLAHDMRIGRAAANSDATKGA